MAKRIPWDNDEEITRLKELVAEGLGWPDISTKLQKEFKDTRPKNDDGKRKKRSPDSIFWYHQRLQRKEKDERGETIQRRARGPNKKNDVYDAPEEGYRIVVINSAGTTVMMITTNKDIDEINRSMKGLF